MVDSSFFNPSSKTNLIHFNFIKKLKVNTKTIFYSFNSKHSCIIDVFIHNILTLIGYYLQRRI